MTRTLTATLVGVTPYSQSRSHDEPLIDEKESRDDYDRRTWRSKAHFLVDTRQVYVPPMSLKLAVAEAAKRLSISIPGKGTAKFTKNVLSGVLILDEPLLFTASADKPVPLIVDDMEPERVHVHANGVRGSGKRVWRTFPVARNWQTTARITVIDNEIPPDVIERCLREAGSLIGIGRFRPERGGHFGRFEVTSMQWSGIAGLTVKKTKETSAAMHS